MCALIVKKASASGRRSGELCSQTLYHNRNQPCSLVALGPATLNRALHCHEELRLSNFS